MADKEKHQTFDVNGHCSDCGELLGKDDGPPGGWELKDGRNLCHACCVEDTSKIINSKTINSVIEFGQSSATIH